MVANKTTLTCFDVAKYLLCLQDAESGEFISHLKLQKLVYYAQGFNLAMYHKPLFLEDIEAWVHGPVVPDLYQRYKIYHDCFIPKPTDCDYSIYDTNTKELLNEVYRVLGQYSAWKLREMTHEEVPWKNAYSKGNGTVITHEDLKNYFQAYIDKD